MENSHIVKLLNKKLSLSKIVVSKSQCRAVHGKLRICECNSMLELGHWDTVAVMELAEPVRRDLCSLSVEEVTQYLARENTSKDQFFSESKYCSLHLILTEAVRNVLSQDKLKSLLSECRVDNDVR